MKSITSVVAQRDGKAETDKLETHTKMVYIPFMFNESKFMDSSSGLKHFLPFYLQILHLSDSHSFEISIDCLLEFLTLSTISLNSAFMYFISFFSKLHFE